LQLPEIRQDLCQRWGVEILDPDGRVDRAKVAQIVFSPPPAGPREREYLEHLTHPEIARRLWAQAEALAALGTAVAVLDAPLLLEAGWDRFCDKLVFVEAPREARVVRAAARGLSLDGFSAREAAQQPLDSKRGRADLVVDNSGSPAETHVQVERLWRSLMG
jgi:dephospho-CoA kinase